ncbi:MAG: cellulase family glycosylhydrolase [Bacteroidaceae bacterium]|nr:cellulase family glycosylhydrolase [Bacteroidaceae bacterium]
MKKTVFAGVLGLFLAVSALAQVVPLHVDGRYFKDPDGRVVNLHGFAQTYSPWFNERGTKWTNYDVRACLAYNQSLIDDILAAGWKMDFVRLHMDPYWSNIPGRHTKGENDISAFSMERFKKYLDEVFVPMAEYAIGKGLYVIMRPPGVCPMNIRVGDDYQKYLMQVWDYVSRHPRLRNNAGVMFELANEPVNILGADGRRAGTKELTAYLQPIVKKMRRHCRNILLIPGLGWQSHYADFVKYPVKGKNIGYAVHCYPGWYNGGHGEGDVVVNYTGFKQGWDEQIMPLSRVAPMIVTEMDWAPSKYRSSWGKSDTGVAGGKGFGANFRKLADECGNMGWLLFTSPELLARFKDEAPQDGNHTFLTDPEACPWPCYHWFEEYKNASR